MVGNTPNFSKADILRCFLRLDKNIGRQELSRGLGLGEGTVRSILEILKGMGLLDSTKKGHLLSGRGSELRMRILGHITIPKEFEMKEFYPEFKKTAITIKSPNPFSSTYRLRDIAVKSGAEGALILRYEKRMQAPEDYYADYFKKLENIFHVEKGDVLVASFGENSRQAEIGALSIAAQLSDEVKKFMKEVPK